MNRIAIFCKTLRRIAHVQLRRYSTTQVTTHVIIEISEECDEALPSEPVAPAPTPLAKPPRLDQPSPDVWAIAELHEEQYPSKAA
jgi:hypothetical protein